MARMSGDIEEPSQAVRPTKGKRPARIALSDSEDDEDRATTTNGVNGHSKRPRPSLQTDGDDSLDLISDEEEAPRRRQRRLRSATDEHSEGAEDDGERVMEDEEIDAQGGQPVHIGFRPEYERGSDGFVAGSITRIMMRNFMTYDYVEFKPGPHLNMILGPNGTGKSSIAACIAVGLGFPPMIMGRANDLKAYVKQGAEVAETEIELKGKRGQRNISVRRKFNREDNKSEWLMNGRSTTHKAVTDLVNSMGVQANNLCSFLPQDKVAEFAKMAPVQVLKETMRAAGDPRLTRWHETLKEKGAQSKLIEETLEKDTVKRDELQRQVDRMEPDVHNVRQREDQEERLEILKLMEIGAEHKMSTDRFKEIGVERKALHVQRAQLLKRHQPLLDLQEKQEELKSKAEAGFESSKDELDNYYHKMKTIKHRVDKFRNADNAYETDLKHLNQKLKERQQEKEQLRRKIRNAQAKIDQPRVDLTEQMKDKGAQRRAVQARLNNAEEEKDKVQDNYNEIVNEVEHFTKEINDLDKRQRELSSIEKQREDAARDFDGSINYALDWIEQNAMKLEGTVHKPPMISVNVKDKSVAWQVEACTTVAQRKCFVCESKADYDTLLALNNREFPARRSINGAQHLPAGRVRLTLQYIEPTDANVNPPRPCDQQTLARLGFSGFAIDYCDCAPAVRAYLIKVAHMHQSAISKLPSARIDSKATTTAGIRTWITMDDINRAVRSAYGRQEYQITTTPPTAAKAFNYAVDTKAIEQNQRELAARKSSRQEKEKPLQDLKKELNKHKDKCAKIDEELKAAEDELHAVRAELGSHQKARNDKAMFEKDLAALEAEPSAEEQRAKVKTAKLRIIKKYSGNIDRGTEHTEDALGECSKHGKTLWASLQYGLNTAAIEEHVAKGHEATVEVDQAINTLDAERDRCRVASQRLVQELKVKMVDCSPTVSQKFKDKSAAGEIPPLTVVQDQIAEVTNTLELTVGVDPRIIERFDRLSAELNDLKVDVQSQEDELAKLKRQINKILSDFDPALDTLVDVVSGKFSAAFERVGCSGEVRLNRVEGNFAAWGIHIMVSYRDGDSLQQLTGQRQSGGERSLATVTYLMSLSEMARTPFSLVDEINQGMDQRAERNVHNQLVEVTCDSDAGQYFLITPKLLTGLRYHRNMKILIVNNGMHLADSTSNLDKRFGDLRGCLQRYKTTHRVAAR